MKRTLDRSGLLSTPEAALRGRVCRAKQAGFTMMEMIVAMAMFMIVSAASISLFIKQQGAMNQSEGQVGLNIGLRNATSQLQMDLANAGTGQFVGINIPAWPVGATIFNANGAGCHTAGTTTYTATCFDTMNIISVDLNTPPIHSNAAGGGCTTTNAATSFGDPAAGLTVAQTAALFHAGDQILFLDSAATQITTVVLTSDATVSGAFVQFDHNATNADGTNTDANDPLGISTHANNRLAVQFCNTDWILKVQPIRYFVDATDANNPKLMRSQNGNTATVMEQLIGFKVGATIWNNGTDAVSTQYNYDSSSYTNDVPNDAAYNFTLVRSVRLSLIGRTAPNLRPSYTFRNTFDQGPYQIQGAAVVVNPRNLSMND